MDPLALLRTLVFAAAAACAVLAAIDWAVRTRRLSPFGPIARFCRATVDPLMAPIERRVVRAGGLPSSAPWWALAVVVVGGIILISVADFVVAQIASAALLVSRGGARGLYVILVSWTFQLLQLALLVRVLSSWINVSPYSGWVRWAYVLSEPVLRPLRRIVPTLGMIDITPIVAYFLLGFLESFLLRLA